jgi:hypothetical protein
MKDDRIEADTIEEAEAESELVKLTEDRAADFDDGELGRLGRVRGRGKYAKVAFNLALCSDGV